MRWRLIAAFVGVTIVILAAQNIPLARYLRTVESERVLAGVQRDAFILAGSSEDALSSEDPANEQDLQASVDVYRAKTGALVVVTDGDGVAVAVSGDEARIGGD